MADGKSGKTKRTGPFKASVMVRANTPVAGQSVPTSRTDERPLAVSENRRRAWCFFNADAGIQTLCRISPGPSDSPKFPEMN